MIVLQNISKYYYTDTSVTQALRKVNLEFHAGEFVAITGESGSGKSTLLNVISGMDTFDDGELYFDGQPTFQFDAADWEEFRRDRIGFVFQNYNLIGQYSALDNVKSALLIMGMEEQKAKEKAFYYLEKVGLKGMEHQRASELSSGQKQRLSIARALAKETSIIVADEPTGNLDSETGRQIVELLKEISGDKLVLMVTHNYEQAEPYVTRKVRLHDGEVVVDVLENQKESKIAEETSVPKKDQEKKSMKKAAVSGKTYKRYQNKIAWIFAAMNSRTQRGRAFLFRVFFLFTAAVSFILIGQLFRNADDTATKDYQEAIYCQKNDSRLSVRRMDGGALTTGDIEKMQSVRNVVQVDQYDYANDVNYYIDEGKDYRFTTRATSEDVMEYDYDGAIVSDQGESGVGENVELVNKKKFMRSTTCISETDLAEGRMPKNRYEIVLYDKDKSRLNQETDIYFTAQNIMGGDAYYYHKFKIVGLLKEKTSQVYFHGDMCHMLSAAADGDEVSLDYHYVEIPYQKYMLSDQFYVVIGDDLKGMDVRASENYQLPNGNYDTFGLTVKSALPGKAQLHFHLNRNRKGYSKKLEEQAEQPLELNVLDEFNDQTGGYLEVSEKLYKKLFSRKSTQASVYIKNYTKTDKVIRALKDLGYDAVSTYRISSVDYNPQKVTDRLVFICIALGILLVLVIVEILILRALMKIKIKDFYVLKSMGMKLGMIKKISFYEMSRYCIEAMLVTVIVMTVLSVAGIPMLEGMMIYYGFFAYAAFFLYNFVLECMAVWSFNRLLKGRMAA